MPTLRDDCVALWVSRISTNLRSPGLTEGTIWVMFRGRTAERSEAVQRLVADIYTAYVLPVDVEIRYLPDEFNAGYAKHKLFFESYSGIAGVAGAQSGFYQKLVMRLDEWLVRTGVKRKDMPPGEGWVWPKPDLLLKEMDRAVRATSRRRR